MTGPDEALVSPAVVALGGGHGLAASLAALRRVTDRITAVVTVADDGGSSGRLRQDLGVLPPGDLRMALAALCGDDEWGRTWARVLQHRFEAPGDLHDHAVGNVLIVALWELLGDQVAGLEWVGRLLGAHGRVLPMAAVPLVIKAAVTGLVPGDPDQVSEVVGQTAVATTVGDVQSVSLVPDDPPARPEAVAAVNAADWVVLGPGSWFTSVIPHLLVPELRDSLENTTARRVVTVNLSAQPGETEGFTADMHLDVLRAHAPGLRIDAVIADPSKVGDGPALKRAAAAMGAELVLADVAMADGSPRHHPEKLSRAYASVFGMAGSPSWQ